MKLKSKKLAGLVAVAAITLPATVYAATTTIEATANFLAAITLANNVDMDFATIEFTGAPAGGDTADLGTDGSIVYGGNFSGAGTGTAGSVDITTGTDGQTVEVFCDATATMAEAGGGTIDVVAIEVAAEGATGTFAAAGSACNGVGGAAATSMVLDIAGNTADQFFFGGQVDGATAVGFVAGAYSSATAGGDDIQIDVFYQ